MLFVKKTFAPEQIATARTLYDDPGKPLEEVAAALGITRGTLKSRIAEWGWPERRAGAPALPAGKPGKRGKNRAASRSRAKGKEAQAGAPANPRAPDCPRASRSRATSIPANPAAKGRGPRSGVDRGAGSRRTAGRSQRARAPAPTASEHDGAVTDRLTPEALADRVQRVVERELDAIEKVLSAIGAADTAEAERSARTLASLARALKEVMRLTAPEETPEADDDDPIPRDLDEFRRELARRLEALAAGAEAAPAGDRG